MKKTIKNTIFLLLLALPLCMTAQSTGSISGKVIDSENNELKMGEHEIRFSQAAGIDYNGAESLVEGGECITITLLEPQDIDIYSVDGRKVRSINAKKGTTQVVVPGGIYIVNGEKVVVQQ